MLMRFLRSLDLALYSGTFVEISGMINKPSQKSASPIDFAASLYSQWVSDFTVGVLLDGILLSWSCTSLMQFPRWKCMTKKSHHCIDFPMLNGPIMMLIEESFYCSYMKTTDLLSVVKFIVSGFTAVTIITRLYFIISCQYWDESIL